MTMEEWSEQCNTGIFENDRRRPQAKEGWPLETGKQSPDNTQILTSETCVGHLTYKTVR